MRPNSPIQNGEKQIILGAHGGLLKNECFFPFFVTSFIALLKNKASRIIFQLQVNG